MTDHFVTIRLAYTTAGTPWKRVAICLCGWKMLSWDGYRPIRWAHEHVATNRQFDTIVGQVDA